MHTGGLPGYVSKVFWIPDAGLGVTVLTNQESAAAFDSIRVLALPITSSARRLRLGRVVPHAHRTARRRRWRRREEGSRHARRDRPAPRLPRPLYAGTYADAWYGDIVIGMEKDKLAMRFTKTPALVGDLEHWQHDTFIVRWRDRELRADAYVTFALNPDGTIDQAKMRAVSPEEPTSASTFTICC